MFLSKLSYAVAQSDFDVKSPNAELPSDVQKDSAAFWRQKDIKQTIAY